LAKKRGSRPRENTRISSPGDIPNQAGKLAVVTGATGGIGFDAALELA